MQAELFCAARAILYTRQNPAEITLPDCFLNQPRRDASASSLSPAMRYVVQSSIATAPSDL